MAETSLAVDVTASEVAVVVRPADVTTTVSIVADRVILRAIVTVAGVTDPDRVVVIVVVVRVHVAVIVVIVAVVAIAAVTDATDVDLEAAAKNSLDIKH